MPSIKSQGSAEQQAKWMPLCFNLSIIGTYAQVRIKVSNHAQAAMRLRSVLMQPRPEAATWGTEASPGQQDRQ